MTSPLALALSLLLATHDATATPAPKATTSDLAALMPADTVAFLEMPSPADLWSHFVESGLWSQLRAIPAWGESFSRGDGLRLVAGIGAMRAALGVDLEEAFSAAAGGGIAVGLVPDSAAAEGGSGGARRGRPGALLVVRATEPSMLARIQDSILELAGLRSGGEWISDRGSVATHSGVEVVTIGPDFHHAIVGDLLLASNGRARLDAAIDRVRAAAPEGSLAGRADFAVARSHAPAAGAPALFGWLDARTALPLLPRRSLQDDGRLEPFPALLFDGMRQSVLGSDWLAGWARVEPGAFVLTGLTSAKPRQAVEAFLPEPIALAPLSVPRSLATLTLRRDACAFWDLHDQIVGPEHEAGFEKFNATAGILFGARRFDEDILAKLAPAAQLVVARQTYASLPSAPIARFPAVGLVLRATDPSKKFLDGIVRAFQTGVTLASADRAQKGMSALLIGDDAVGDTKITYASFPEPESAGAVGPEQNLSPAIFTQGDRIVIATTLELARDLARALPDAAVIAADAAQPLDLLRIDVGQAAEALRENLKPLIASAVLEKGKSRADATREHAFLLGALSLLSEATVATRIAGEGLEMRIEVRRAGPVTAPQPADGAKEGTPRRVTR